jgi:hypothetical protein
MTFLENWIELEIIMLSEISQSYKEKYHMLSVICRSWVQESGDGQNKRKPCIVQYMQKNASTRLGQFTTSRHKSEVLRFWLLLSEWGSQVTLIFV